MQAAAPPGGGGGGGLKVPEGRLVFAFRRLTFTTWNGALK